MLQVQDVVKSTERRKLFIVKTCCKWHVQVQKFHFRQVNLWDFVQCKWRSILERILFISSYQELIRVFFPNYRQCIWKWTNAIICVANIHKKKSCKKGLMAYDLQLINYLLQWIIKYEMFKVRIKLITQ